MITVMLFLCLLIIVVTSKIVQVHVLSRHCDRVPFFRRQIPVDPINWNKALDMDFEELTALGQFECHALGVNLQSRYLDTSSPNFVYGINPDYRGYDYLFEASDTNRTMRTCYSVGMGLFPIGTGRKVDVLPGVCALPQCSQSIPIRTIADAGDDPILRGFINCDYYRKLMADELLNDKEYHEKYSADAERINALLGFKGKDYIPLQHWDVLFDLVNCQKDHHLLHVPGFNETVFEKICEIKNNFCKIQFRRKITGAHVGGNFVKVVVEGMNKVIQNVTHFKYKQYCAHDMTVLSVASALGMTQDHPAFQQQPGYGSSLVFELHEVDNDESCRRRYFVKIMYLLSYNDTFVPYPLGPTVGECDVECPYEKFVDIVQKNCMATEEDFCNYCQVLSKMEMCFKYQKHDNHNKRKEETMNVGLIVSSSVGGFFVLMWVVTFLLLICTCLVCLSLGVALGAVWFKTRKKEMVLNSEEESRSIYNFNE